MLFAASLPDVARTGATLSRSKVFTGIQFAIVFVIHTDVIFKFAWRSASYGRWNSVRARRAPDALCLWLPTLCLDERRLGCRVKQKLMSSILQRTFNRPRHTCFLFFLTGRGSTCTQMLPWHISARVVVAWTSDLLSSNKTPQMWLGPFTIWQPTSARCQLNCWSQIREAVVVWVRSGRGHFFLDHCASQNSCSPCCDHRRRCSPAASRTQR